MCRWLILLAITRQLLFYIVAFESLHNHCSKIPKSQISINYLQPTVKSWKLSWAECTNPPNVELCFRRSLPSIFIEHSTLLNQVTKQPKAWFSHGNFSLRTFHATEMSTLLQKTKWKWYFFYWICFLQVFPRPERLTSWEIAIPPKVLWECCVSSWAFWSP